MSISAPLTPALDDLLAELRALGAGRDLATARGMDAAAALLEEGRRSRLARLLLDHPEHAEIVGEQVTVAGVGAVGSLTHTQAAALGLNRRTM